MAHAQTTHTPQPERFELTPSTARILYMVLGLGIVLALVGFVLISMGGGEHAAAEGHGGHGPAWLTRLWAALLVNSMYYSGAAVIGVFFIAVSTVANAGWFIVVKRIAEAMGGFLPIGFVLMVIVVIFGGHSLYHWMDTAAVAADKLLKGKAAFLNEPFFYARLVTYFAIWTGFWWMIRQSSIAEDSQPGTTQFGRTKALSAGFLILFGLTISAAGWDWAMSLDPHWFSTMFGIHFFATLFVTGLCFLTLIALHLKREGFLPSLNDSHIHDLGKFVFAFSVFWTYIVFCQFLLIWYANIPEEGKWYFERMSEGSGYKYWFLLNFGINFLLPMLGLMQAGAKRHRNWLTIICIGILFGHLVDIYLMVYPSLFPYSAHTEQSLGLFEVGLWMTFGAVFLLVVANMLKRAALVPKNNPYLQESLHHHYEM